ncbi:MAG: hypothetical protein CL581_09290 [Alteromonadaceae bacterium]|nr:hypothetical protein [Alteromonadaceae bacterium]
MAVIGQTSHALFFNGVSDSVVCPQGGFTQTGQKRMLNDSEARSSASVLQDGDSHRLAKSKNQSLNQFCIEAWVSPDAGGIIASKDGLFELRMGSVNQPAPASFTVTMSNGVSMVARSVNNYPTAAGSFVANNVGFNIGQRELYHISGEFTGLQVKLYINGELIASRTMNQRNACTMNDQDLYLGGKGGEYRGYIESVHWRTDIDNNRAKPFVVTNSTLGLWRFEEPVSVDATTFNITSNVAAGDTTITIGATACQTLYETVSGKSDTLSTNYTLESLGNYRVANAAHSGGAQVISVAHTPFNLLINPTATDTMSAIANNSPPERIRLKQINTNGTITVESIHLDFNATADTGSRGVLHSRTAFNSTNNLANDSTMVLIRSDLLIDSETGKPHQRLGTGSQAIDRTGAMVIDESRHEFHGFMYSRTLAVNTNNFAPASWTIDERFKSGHTGRHCFNHLVGHPYLRMLPPIHEQEVSRTIDGVADSAFVMFAASYVGLKDQLPINSKVAVTHTAFNGRIMRVDTSAKTNGLARNGLASLDAHEDGVIAISVDDIRPFLLKGGGLGTVSTSDSAYLKHLTPETESRVALLEVSGLTAGYVEIHYNAVDLTGGKMGLSNPALLITKTVPDGGCLLDGKRVAAHIADAVGAGATIHAPGGVIYAFSEDIGNARVAMQPHHLVGDNTGGIEYEEQLDESKIPSNYTPSASGDSPRAPPQGVGTTTHPSSYHHIHLQPRKRSQSDPPANESPSHYQESKHFASQKGGAFEMFDVIDNDKDGAEYFFVVQPSKRERTMQLSRVTPATSDAEDPTYFTLEYIQTKVRINSMNVNDGAMGRQLIMQGRGIMADVADQTVPYNGDGSPDSHIVKEIQPGAPVVSVTLGGAGQGAVNTKPTWDPASLSRVGWNTRHDASVEITDINTTTRVITVQPINNNSSSLSSWGTYGFPASGTLYFTNGASVGYVSRTGTAFTCTTATNQLLSPNGRTSQTFAEWVTASQVGVGAVVLLDDKFNASSICADGTTVNDRLFQSIGSVQHDYQLGTQYASTRALVEIPLFPQQFFEDREAGVFPGPDNSMKLHLDATMTAHAWNPSPVGRRAPNSPANDYEAFGQYQYRFSNNLPIRANVQRYDRQGSNAHLYLNNLSSAHRIPSSHPIAAGIVKGVSTQQYRRVVLGNGEWAYYTDAGGTRLDLSTEEGHSSKDFFSTVTVGSSVFVGVLNDGTNFPMTGDDDYKSSAQEYRRPFYYDRASVMTQGGNLDYGLRQYASAVEFKAGPLVNPHLPRIESRNAKLFTIKHLSASPAQTFIVKGNLPTGKLPTGYSFAVINESTGRYYKTTISSSSFATLLSAFEENLHTVRIEPHPVLDSSAPALSIADTEILTIVGIYADAATTLPLKQEDGIANSTWNNPYCPGGLRYGDTVWMNMHYTNPHAIEGMFCKSRGVLNEYEVWSGFNGGKGALGVEARDSLPVENFLIGNTCLETARNFVQHVNKTIELNWTELGYQTDPDQADYNAPPVVAFLDPYLSTETHARVLLYDVAHDREFIAFHDLHMQVQTSAATPTIEGLDVAAGFKTQRKDKATTSSTDAQSINSVTYNLIKEEGKSRFVEGAYAHGSWWLMDQSFMTTSGIASFDFNRKARKTEHLIKFGEETSQFGQGRVEQSTVSLSAAQLRHAETMDLTASSAVIAGSRGAYQFSATFFDTPDGTRVISAFLCMKGKRAVANSLTSHYESRLQHLPHWSDMDFVRRLTVDMGEIGLREGVTDIEAAAREVVRIINQGGALNGRSSQRRPSDQYAGEGERFDINRRSISVGGVDTEEPTDATAAHQHADFAVTGSTHDPAPFWTDNAFTSFDRGTHMGYVRAHLGRVVEDANGNEGFSIVIHSTVPGATGRNFCVWLDNSKGQVEYKPQFLIGHGGRFRNFYCAPPEIAGENMHPAPMPIDKNGKPFAPITTLREYVSLEDASDEFFTNLYLGDADNFNTSVGTEQTPNTGATTGRSSNTGAMESFENAGQKFTIREGLQIGTRARGRINFGGIVAAGIPGFAPDAGIWGFGENGKSQGRFSSIYGENLATDDSLYNIYNTYAPTSQTDDDAVGTQSLYGMKMVDHRGRSHIIRYIYRRAGESFSNRNSVMPKTIDEETLIHFDDRDIAQGGFTIGANMWGKGTQGTPFYYTGTTEHSWKGNKWRGVHTPNAGFAVTIDTSTANNTLTLNDASGYGYHNGGIWHHLPDVDDVLGWMGFPNSGLVWLAIPSSASQYENVGVVFSYTSRTHNGRGGEHSFFGVEGVNASSMASSWFNSQDKCGPTSVSNARAPVIISPHLNQTTIVTDELIAEATAHAFTVDPNENDQYFDCSHLRAPDGRTYGEIMGNFAATAIRITTFNREKQVVPLRNLFSVSLSRDWGISASTKEADPIVASFSGGGQFGGINSSSSSQAINETMLDCGYLPYTLLNIVTRYRGHNANTATPLLIDQTNNAVSTDAWLRNLRGTTFTRYEGDHITPSLEATTFRFGTMSSPLTYPSSNADTYQLELRDLHHFEVVGRQYAWQKQHISGGTNHNEHTSSTEFGGSAVDGSWSPFKRMDINENTHVFCVALSSIAAPTDISQQRIAFHHGDTQGDMTSAFAIGVVAQPYKYENDIQGLRLRANRRGNPLLYFRGAHDGIDHHVPLYFGGGFSGVVMDINDGSRVDYSTHNKHPYANGPTGSAGMQDIGEKMGAYALLDTTALFAMFPAAVVANQHRGEPTPPFANQDAILNTDIDGNTNSHTIPNTTYTNVKIAKPTPVILRFAHPYARYDDSVNSVAYMVFGPGQAVPKHWYGEGVAVDASVEPSAKWTAAFKKYCSLDGATGTTFKQGNESGYFFPNELSNGTLDGASNQFLPPTDAYGANNVFPYKAFRHWEPSYGSPNSNFNQTSSLHARYVSSHFWNASSVASSAVNEYAHPFSFYSAAVRFGSALTEFLTNKLIFHLDGGYTAGGSWFDNSVRKNAPHPVTATLVNSVNAPVQYIDRLGLNATMFRVGSQVLTDYDHDINATVPDDVFLIDATRCQNSEELGAVVASAINTWPGRANLKALGGSFLPSFQDAQRQDRYGWIDVGDLGTYTDQPHGLVSVGTALPMTLPENGWIRVTNGTKSYYGYYAHYDVAQGTFVLGNNFRAGRTQLEEPTRGGDGAVSTLEGAGHKVYVWSKAGNLRWDNGFQNAVDGTRATSSTTGGQMSNGPFDHYATTQVHFNGVTDAIDRTRAVGAVGWHGERYSYLNSLNISNQVAAGLGAWHPMLGFNPYGPGMACHYPSSMEWILRLSTGSGAEENSEMIWEPKDATHEAVGLHQRHFIVISYEGDLPIIAKASRNGQQACGDMLQLKWGGTQGGTVTAYHNERFNNDRYNAESNAGPHVEALHDTTMTTPVDSDGNRLWTGAASTSLAQMETCLYPTGDLFFDKLENANNQYYPNDNLFDSETAKVQNDGYGDYAAHRDDIFNYWKTRNSARNFFVEHVVWKRMSGGNLTLPAQNARGLGSMPWQVHKVGSEYIRFGETIYGNVRFSFETTNAAMFPIIQAQELAHPALAEQFPYEVRNALTIPNEEHQFQEMLVVDDTGQEHTLEGGSPLGVVIRDYELVHDRDNEGLAPALAGSGVSPNMQIQLPDHDDIPGNILVRAGFDRLQAYQHETLGSGGLQHPTQPVSGVTNAFESDGGRPRTEPFWEQDGYEHINQSPNHFPDSNNSLQSQNILETAYEPHDRALYFHITKMGYTYTEREPLSIVNNAMTLNRLTIDTTGTDTITAKETITADIWKQDPTPDGRYFLSVNGAIASFTNVSGKQFTGVVFAPDFTASENDSIKPSFYVPAGSTRHFAARRLRDHAEVSGNSPDKANTDWGVSAGTSPATAVRAANKLTPMPLPRMGHHYVMPTMSVLPGHLAHPQYQQIYGASRACFGATEYDTSKTIHNPLLWFSGPTASHPPSDIHGDGFTLLTETKLRFDGYGIADDSAACNKAGGHRIQLESGTNYNTSWNFPDPAEVGAYQIVIQPNLFSKQFMGNNENTAYANDNPPEDPITTHTTKRTLTDQLVATVVALQWNSTQFDLILSEATMADTRGCEIFINELILDHDASTREQFANTPTLGLANPFGVNASSSGAFTRRSMPYHPNMFHRASPGHTVTVPWWSVALASSTIFATNNWKRIDQYQPDDYYMFCRSTLGGVGCQTTMLGYPSHYLDVYTEYLTSVTPTAIVENGNQGASKLFVRNNTLFPLVGSNYYNHHLVIVDANGIEQTATYTDRGYISQTGATGPVVFNGVTAITNAFWTAVVEGAVVRLSSPYNTKNEIYTNSKASVATRNLPQLLSGTRDTNSLHIPDAYLCMWHYNLGRPMTWFSDSRTNKVDAAVDKKAYNHAPEHYEMVHYHEFAYAMSDGPFNFRMKAWEGPGDGLTDSYPDSNYPHQAGADGKSRKYQLGAFWPGGHRFGAQMSSLSLYGTCAPGWRNKWDDPNIKQVSDAKGLTVTNANVETMTETINSASTSRNAGWGYRVSVRQPYNRPRWAIKSNQALRDPYASYHFQAEGPFVSNEAVTTTTTTQDQSTTTPPTATATPSYVGILERQTNASALVGSDLKGQQVKYSDGRRMTKGFGCAVRNIRNPSTALRRFHADMPAGLKAGTDVVDQRVNLALAHAHYMVDWWGNTTGEEVRRFPVRGFGVRPSWDPEDAYRATDRTKVAETMFTDTALRTAVAAEQFFDPATAKRVGDRGDGRGVRYPTYFNEDILQDVSEDMRPFGLVLSHHTSEPAFTRGFIRPSNTTLEPHEMPRGISSRLEVAGSDGLLKREANVSANIEKSNFTFAQEPLGKAKPRIGLDGMSVVENDGRVGPAYVIANTEAHSLHTDRQVGQRFILAGGVSTANRAVDNLNLHTLNFSSAKQVLKFGTTHGIPPLGGTYILEVSSDGEAISDHLWGSSSGATTNPYQTSNHNSLSAQTNTKDTTIKFLLRPVRVLDKQHIELFRDDTTHVLSATAAGRYGVFVYDAPNARATDSASTYMRGSNPSPSNPPYAPVYLFNLSSSTSEPASDGPKIPGSEASDFTTDSTQPVARMIVSNNTLQHFRGDASRRQSAQNGQDKFIRLDYSVQPRYTQSLYAGDKLNTSNHSSEGDRTDMEASL